MLCGSRQGSKHKSQMKITTFHINTQPNELLKKKLSYILYLLYIHIPIKANKTCARVHEAALARRTAKTATDRTGYLWTELKHVQARIISEKLLESRRQQTPIGPGTMHGLIYPSQVTVCCENKLYPYRSGTAL